jgi:hypothetical protein
MKKIIAAAALAGAAVLSLAACGSSAATSASTSASASASTSAAGSPAPIASASSAPVASATAQGTAPAAALWCGSVINVRTAPSLTVWETGSGGADDVYVNVIPQLKAGVIAIDNPSLPAATVLADSGSICSEVLEAHEEPPPVDLAQYNKALAYFLQASEVLHTGASAYAASLATARVEMNSGMSELNTFLTAIGK